MGQNVSAFLYGSLKKGKFLNTPRVLLVLEIGSLMIAALWLGQDYLVLNEDLIPGVGEFHLVVQSHHFWTRLAECGACALWNGSIRGGFPALVELQGAILHPIVATTTLLFGVINGAKYTVVLAFFLAGVAQLWLGYELRLSPVPRSWASLLGVLGTHLAGRMATGFVQVVLSTSMASFVFPAVIALARRGKNRQAVMLGVALASLGLSGQGYIQIALLFTLPAMLFLFISKTKRRLLKQFMVATVLAILLIGILLVPLIHFGTNLRKITTVLSNAKQPIHYFLLNFVVDDLAYFYTEELLKTANPVWTAFFIGWLPVILIVLTFFTLRSNKRKERPFVFYLLASSLILIVLGNGALLVWLAKFASFINLIRFPTLMTPLAVPPLLGVAAYTLDRIVVDGLIRTEIPIRFFPRSNALWPTVRWLLVILLGWNVYNVASFSRQFTKVHEFDEGFIEVLDSIKIDGAQWVNFPTDDWFFIETAIRRGFKLSPMFLPYHWHERPIPDPFIDIRRQDLPPPDGHISSRDIWRYTRYDFGVDREYALIETSTGITPCHATGNGGHIVVECVSDKAGELIVKENYWTGWQAYRDGAAIDFLGEDWIRVMAPAEAHVYEFRYLPVDALLGAIVSGVGIVLSIYLWFTKKAIAVWRPNFKLTGYKVDLLIVFLLGPMGLAFYLIIREIVRTRNHD